MRQFSISCFLALAFGLALPTAASAQEKVTQEHYCRAESDRTFANIAKLAGRVNTFFHYRSVTPLDNQTVVRMNKDTLSPGAVVDASDFDGDGIVNHTETIGRNRSGPAC